MSKLMAVIIAIVLIFAVMNALSVALASSTGTGKASISWERAPGGGDGGTERDSGRDSDRDDYNSRPYNRADIINTMPAPEAIVSTPNPQIPLGRLPDTGGDHLRALLFLTMGMSFVLIYILSGKDSCSP